MKMIFNIIKLHDSLTILTMMRGSVIRLLICLTLMVTLVGYGAASLSTLHIHVLPDGRLVVHSHPLPDDEGRHEHGHTQQEYVAIQAATRALETGGLISDDEALIEFPVCGISEVGGEQPLPATLVSAASGRAPPESPQS
jgi:hypothetical protein